MKIYVAIPNLTPQGGVESLYQLVSGCRKIGYDAYVYYFEQNRAMAEIPDCMRIKYNLQVVEVVEDIVENIIVCPETYTYLLRKFHRIKKCIWFLSLDYYLESALVYRTRMSLRKWKLPIFLIPLAVCAKAVLMPSSLNRIRIQKDRIPYYLYNCEYAYKYIKSVCNYSYFAHYLCGPIDDIYFQSGLNIKKEKIVSYNPKKSTSYTNKLIEIISITRPDILFIPIENMTTEEVHSLLMRSAVYMDLGKFPGPERIPREAAMMRCNIIASTMGSAGDNDIDVPIRASYKFELVDSNLEKIKELLIDMVDNYDFYVETFDEYRQKVIEQKQRMLSDIKEFFSICDNSLVDKQRMTKKCMLK